ncbi:MAG: hypothetical protein E7315_06615 [Clostridiales bacterium]|nr:hypothetical protein [Clostridiales bacterium]
MKSKISFNNKILIYVLFFVMVLLFDRLFNPVSIDNITLVSGIGIDVGDSGDIKLSVQVLVPNASQGSSGANVSTKVITTQSEALLDAMYDIEKETGNTLVWSHCTVVLMSDEFMSEDIMPHIELLYRSYKFRDSAWMLVTKNDPQKMLESDMVYEDISAFGIQHLMTSAQRRANAVILNLKSFIEAYYSEAECCLMTELGVTEESENMCLASAGVIKKGRLVGFLTESQIRGYCLVNHSEISEAFMMIHDYTPVNSRDKMDVGISVYRLKTKVKPYISDNGVTIKIRIRGETEIKSSTGSLVGINAPKDILDAENENMKKAIADMFIEKIREAYGGMRLFDGDYMGIYNLFYDKYPNEPLEEILKDFDENHLSFDIDVDVRSANFNSSYK